MEELYKSPRYLKTVGPKRVALLKKLNIHTIRDLLHYYPARWEDRKHFKPIASLQHEEVASVLGQILTHGSEEKAKKIAIFKLPITDGTGVLWAVWFKKSQLKYDVFGAFKNKFKPGQKIIVYGKIKYSYGYKEIVVEEYELLSSDEENESLLIPYEKEEEESKEETKFSLHVGRIVPIYKLTEGLSNKFFRELMYTVVSQYCAKEEDVLPENIRKKYNLCRLSEALQYIHFPTTWEQRDTAHKRIVFEEFLLFQLAVQIARQKYKSITKPHSYVIKRHLLTPFRQNLNLYANFDFTSAQKRAINEIFRDMLSPQPMSRLLQGDVGSGKTVVALSAVLLCAENNHQAAFMAPTEILAEQHYITFKRFLSSIPVKFALLTSKTTRKERQEIISKLKSNELNFVVGTHAIIEDDVVFPNLKLIVIDEQHKFGVLQRQALYNKGTHPDVLVLTATPIPRTLSLTLYGDLDVSTLDELPPGRMPVKTLHLTEEEAYMFVKREVEKKHQAYIVYPIVEESDKMELKSAVKEAKVLQEKVFTDYRVGLLHGQMKGSEKEKIMLDFYNGHYDILITTTVIEVGIDVPNATVIVIQHSDRFGLATLHQLRGRVGRSKYQSYCILVGTPKTNEAKKRLEVMLSTNDGFKIAEEDLLIRGPGEIFGTRQHGKLSLADKFSLGDIIRDKDILYQTNNLAHHLVQEGLIYKDEYRRLLQKVYKLYSNKDKFLKAS
jgi:ATP-dependent DNA helicase RecG